MIKKLQKFIFFGVVFFISSQVGFHFWPEFSKVSGVRIDYLSPTFYLLDLLIIALFLSTLNNSRKFFLSVKKIKIPKLLVFLFILSLAWGIFYSKSPQAHIYGILRIIEFLFLGIYVAKYFTKKDIRSFVAILSLSAIVSSFLAIWQFNMQSSIGGFWYFFGERTFNISTIGISTVNLDQQILRPYAAFPHPNVLAFFLLSAITLSFMRLPYEGKMTKIFLILSILFSSLALLLTFSRIIIIAAICLFVYAIYAKEKRNALYFVPILIIMFVLLGYFVSGVLSPQFLLRGIDFRQELLFQSLDIFVKNPYFGIGLNNFFVHQVDLVKNISPILFQPPHNIFVIALLSFGIFGWWIFLYIFTRAVREVFLKVRDIRVVAETADFYKSVLFVLIAIIVVGMFDHFFLTLEQGQIMLALILGLSFANLKTHNK